MLRCSLSNIRNAPARAPIARHLLLRMSSSTRTSSTSTKEWYHLERAEYAAFQKWQAEQAEVQTEAQPVEAVIEPMYASIDKTAAVFLVAGAVTPAVLLVPVWAPLVLVESFTTYIGANAEADGLPFWTMRTAFALVSHPAITLTCAAANALAFASQRSYLNRLGWPPPTAASTAAAEKEAASLGRGAGFVAALVSPLAVIGVHQVLTMGVLDGLMPRALVLDYWAQVSLTLTLTHVLSSSTTGRRSA
jgi:hypothetical protein